MKRAWVELIGLLAVVALAASLIKAEQKARQSAALIGIWQAKYAEASTQRRIDSVYVDRWLTRTKTLRDTLDIHDTLQVKEYVYRTDTLRQACMRCLASAARVNVAADGTQAALRTNQRRWYDRAGLYVGYGFSGSQPTPNLQIGFGIRVLP